LHNRVANCGSEGFSRSQLSQRYPVFAVFGPNGVNGRSFDSVSLAIRTEDLDPGDFVNFASQKSGGDDRAFTVGNLGAGLAHVAGGMIPWTVFGQALASAVMWLVGWRDIRALLAGSEAKSLLSVAHSFRSHPLHLVPSHLIGAIALQAPLVIMSSGYSIATAGMYALAHRVVTMPTLMIANAIGDVYRQEIATAYHATGRFDDIFRKTLARTATLALLPAAAVFWLAPQVFAVVFGPEWRVAGEYARILVVGGFFQFVLTPLDKGALVVGATRYIFWWHTARLLMLGGLFWAVVTLGMEAVTALWLLTAIRVILYVADAVIGYRFARGITR